MRILLLPFEARYITLTLVLVATAALGTAIYFFPSYVIWLAAPTAVFGILSIWGLRDLFQRRHAILRNYPLAAQLRFLFEEIRPEMRQYFFEDEKDGTPFSRDKRAVVYQRSKRQLDKRPFGTQYGVYQVGYEWLHHSMVPADIVKEPFRLKIGGPDCQQPYAASVYNISGMSFGALSPNAIRALNKGAKKGNFAHTTGEGGISKPFLVSSAFTSARSGRLVTGAAAAVFACAAIALSFTTSLTYTATTKVDGAAQRQQQIEDRATLKATYERLEGELWALPLTRPVDSIQADIKRLLATPGAECAADPRSTAYGRVSRRVCPQVASLQGSMATAMQRARITAKIEAAELRLANSKVPGTTDGLIDALSGYLALVGIEWQRTTVSLVSLAILPVLLELGSALWLMLARASMISLGQQQVRVSQEASNTVPSQQLKASQAEQEPPTPSSASVPSVNAARCPRRGLLKLIEASGGTLTVSQRKVAETLETSKSEANRLIRELAGSGALLVETSKTGTRLALA